MKFTINSFLICLVFFSSGTFAQKWLPISGSNFQNFMIDETSLVSYPGSVSFITKRQMQQLIFWERSLYLCGSGEIYGVSGEIKPLGDPVPELLPNISDRGVKEYLNIPNLKTIVSKKCGGPISKKDLEVPLSNSTDKASFALMKSTILSKKFVTLWEKSYPSERQEMMINGEKFLVDGKPYVTTKVITDKGYTLDHIKYDCEMRTFENLALIEYDQNGNVKKSVDFSVAKANPARVVPGSVGMVTFEFACGLRR